MLHVLYLNDNVDGHEQHFVVASQAPGCQLREHSIKCSTFHCWCDQLGARFRPSPAPGGNSAERFARSSTTRSSDGGPRSWFIDATWHCHDRCQAPVTMKSCTALETQIPIKEIPGDNHSICPSDLSPNSLFGQAPILDPLEVEAWASPDYQTPHTRLAFIRINVLRNVRFFISHPSSIIVFGGVKVSDPSHLDQNDDTRIIMLLYTNSFSIWCVRIKISGAAAHYFSPFSFASKTRSPLSSSMSSNYLFHRQHVEDLDGEWAPTIAWVTHFLCLSLEGKYE